MKKSKKSASNVQKISVTKKQKPAAAKAKANANTNSKMTKDNNQTGEDLIKLILEDHKPLKQLIKVMKNSDKYSLNERQEAFEEFAPLLITHAKPEEETMYVFMKDDEELREGGFEGDVEHMLADQLLEEIKRTDDEDLWSARVKVVAELVEHHIEEEEEEMLPDLKKHSKKEDRIQLGAKYLALKEKFVAKGGKDSASEVTMKSKQNKASEGKRASAR